MNLALIEMPTAGNGSTLPAQAAPAGGCGWPSSFPRAAGRGLWKEEGGAGDLGPLRKEARLLPGVRPTCRVGWRQGRFFPSHPPPDD